MHSVGVFEAKNRLTALLDEVEGGGEVIITRRGKPIARLAPLETGFNRVKASAAADGLRTLSQDCSLGDLTIRDLIDEGPRCASSSIIPSRSPDALRMSRPTRSWRSSTKSSRPAPSRRSFGPSSWRYDGGRRWRQAIQP